jgi:2-polyprenyl-6-methoxyphenol hydroxylase-like FAD-dependent oxidoreductase
MGSILVVGAGVAGQGLAAALAQRGLECVLVEQRSASAGLGMGVNLPGNGVRALQALGVGDALAAHGVPVSRREYRNSRGRLLFTTDDAAFWQGVGSPRCLRHGRLLEVLRGGSHQEARIGTRLVAAEPVGDRVAVELEGAGQQFFDFVVGADGVHSAVRSAVTAAKPHPSGLAAKPQPSAMAAWAWRFVGPNPGVDCYTAWSGEDAAFLLIPVEDGQVYGYAAGGRDQLGSDPQWLADTFARFPGPVTRVVGDVLASPAALLHSAVEEVWLRRWHRGRLVVIGDAAHATQPIWAQGAAMALEDALVLADLLAGQRDWSGIGDAFERRRRTRVAHVQAASDEMSRLARLPGWLRDLVAPVLGPRAYRRAYGPLRAEVGPAGRGLSS